MQTATNKNMYIKYNFDPVVKKYMDNLVQDESRYFGPDGEKDYSVFQMSKYAVKWIKSLPPDQLNWWWLAGNTHADIVKMCKENEDAIEPVAYSNRYYTSESRYEFNEFCINDAKRMIEEYTDNKNTIIFFCYKITFIQKSICADPVSVLKNLEDPELADFIINRVIADYDFTSLDNLMRFLRISPFLLHIFFQNNYLDRFFQEEGYKELSKDPLFAPEILKTPQRIAKIDSSYFSLNPHPDAIRYLRNNLDQVCWNTICDNPNLDEFLCNKEYIYDYTYIADQKKFLHEDLMAYCWSPDLIKKIAIRDQISFEEAAVA